ncbi:dynamin family protein [Lelliottia sp. RWM.1]|uniref:dynamin family protein n=1 Tax=Lelliottia sp. RWM.1 TaxID=2663242 RepID=UPI00193D579F|nr:dynamin family protein [Lelliottia sp. RWM.1]MBM3073719.1 hypothetical protein [Lelliottia sp. RWM.1]
MLPPQTEATLIETHLIALRAYWQQYEFSIENLDIIQENIRTFSVRLPLIGAFSAGKSSLINSLLQDNLLSVAIDPETSLPTELHFAPQESITLRRKNTMPLPLSRDALKAQQFGEHDPDNVVDITLPNPILAKLNGMTLVDMPGWESGITQHSLAIDNYLDRSAAYCVVVSVDEGVLKESLRKIIEELAIHDKPMMLVITKCDKKRPEDVEAVVSHVQAQIEKLAKKPLLAVCRTQRRNATEWATALPVLLPLQQQFWHQAIGLPVQKCINDILIRIEQLSQGHNQTLEEIESERELLAEQYQRMQEDVQQITTRLHEQRNLAERAIVDDFASRMNGQLDTLTRALLNGEDVSGTIGHALRMSYSQGVERYLKPVIQKELGQLQLQEELQMQDVAYAHGFKSNESGTEIIKMTLAYILPAAITLITRIPMGKFLTPFIISALEGLFQRGSQELIQRQQQEEARRHVINTVIPSCCSKAAPDIARGLSNTIDDVMQAISRSTDEAMAKVQQTLDLKVRDLHTEKAAEAQRQQTWQADSMALKQMLAQLQVYNHG